MSDRLAMLLSVELGVLGEARLTKRQTAALLTIRRHLDKLLSERRALPPHDEGGHDNVVRFSR